jgi:hypothetical protein
MKILFNVIYLLAGFWLLFSTIYSKKLLRLEKTFFLLIGSILIFQSTMGFYIILNGITFGKIIFIKQSLGYILIGVAITFAVIKKYLIKSSF